MTLRELVERRLNTLQTPIKDALLGGSPQNLHDYHRLVGKLEGMIAAFNEIEGLLRDDEEDLDTGR